MSVRITCITKEHGNHYDPHEAIAKLGWVNEATGESGICTRLEMVKFIEAGNQAYTKDRFGNVAYLVVRVSRSGRKYVKTIADGKETDNLLYLQECR